jgi:hypothetical protein
MDVYVRMVTASPLLVELYLREILPSYTTSVVGVEQLRLIAHFRLGRIEQVTLTLKAPRL